MSRIWAVARHMIAESFRTKIAILFIVLIVLILGTMPFLVTGDGLTVKSRVQNYLAYSLGSVDILLCFLTIFLACGTLSSEILEKQVFMVVSKPIARWQFFVGKWLGVVTLNAMLLLITFGAVLASTWYLKNRPTAVPGDARALQEEVLTIRHNFRLYQPDWNKVARDRIRELREKGTIDQLDPMGEESLHGRIVDEAKRIFWTLPPRQGRVFEFRNLLVDKQKDEFLILHIKPRHPGGTEDASLKAVIICGDPGEPETMSPQISGEFVVERFHNVPIRTFAVNSQNTLYVQVYNMSEADSITFEGQDSFELLYPLGTFPWNTFRALAIIWCRLAFLASLGLMMASFLSFPVACMPCFLILGVGFTGSWIGESLEWTTSAPFREDTLWIFGPPLRLIARAFVELVPNFSKSDAAGNVVGGRLVTLVWVLQALRDLVVVQATLLAIAGCVILTKRELAKVTS